MYRFAAAALAAALATSALAQGPTVIYSEISTSPTSVVPGLGGALFDSFSRPFASPDGSLWIMRASSNLATSEDDVLIIGSGVTGAVGVQEGTQAPWAAAGELVGLLDESLSINDSGHYAFATNLGGTAPTTADEQIVGWTGAFSAVATEGDGVPGFAGEVYGISLFSPLISNGGAFGFGAPTTVGALGSDFDDFLIFNNTVVAQEGVTVPGGSTDAWDLFDTNDFYVAGDGVRWLAQGDVLGDTAADDVVVVNGNVAIREDGAIAGIAGPVETILESFMNSNGDWFARGDVDSQEDWVVVNGLLAAQSGDTVPGGLPGETYDDAVFSSTFFSMTGDGAGNYVLGATTSNADPLADAVLVYNNDFVFARQGDPVDLDGNGLFDDDLYLNVFNNDDAFLTPDGWYYFTADLMDELGVAAGQAFLRMRVPEPTSLSLLVLGAAAALRRRR